MVGKCVKFCCCPPADTGDEGLKLPKCAFAPGVYQNVNIEIGQNCQIISLTPADKEQVNLCDPCDNVPSNPNGGLSGGASGSGVDFSPSHEHPVARDDTFTITQGENTGTAIISNDDLTPHYYWQTGTLPTGVTIDGSGFIRVENTAPVGTYSIPYTLTDNDGGETSTATINLTIAEGQHAEVEAMGDVLTAVIGSVSGDSVLTNDSLSSGVTPSPDDVTLTAINAPSGLTLNANGTVSVASTVSAGEYTFDYQVCDNNGDCAVASVTLTVTAPTPTVQVSNKTFTLAQGETSTVITQGDTLVDGSSPTEHNAIVTVSAVPPELNYNNIDYTVSVNDDAVAGTYTFDYQLCDLEDGDCQSATITVVVPEQTEE